MKRIRIGLTALITVLAMGFTIGSQSNVMKNTAHHLSLANGCYTYLYIYYNESTYLFDNEHNVPVYNGEITLYSWMTGFPSILLNSESTIIEVPGSIGKKIDNPYGSCIPVPNAPLCCLQVYNNRVVFILYGVDFS